MLIVDAHCDTITTIMKCGEGLRKNNCHIDISRLKNYDSYVQFFAAFISPEHAKMGALKRTLSIIDRLYQEIENNKQDIMLCCNYNDMEDAFAGRKIAAVLTIEGGEALEGSLASLRMLYKMGVRGMTLTWNYRNQIADGVIDGISGGGLTPFGRDVITEMNRLGMLIDVSHISEAGFWDVINLTAAPIIASHSNSKKLCSHPRNLTDEQLLALKKNGGVTGLNLYPVFLNDGGKASIKDALSHIEYIVALTGEDTLGLGSDFDGIESTPEGLEGVQCYSNLLNELLKLNYSEGLVKKIAGENFIRVIKSVL
ncbi:dipeptidase [Ruminiclostridium cellobioparum]|uniref:Zn-dependent dipeptidase n=1 Tax=Ruminiclostridium cellobioparum subsp. termitidis CT1112 TaxID=1195236 RepID=S0FPH0_RUMCE|nr:dipeptidase [Ruminiclostridium cellobioparum]EMS71064.1 Zn-dependent dipeptidase [Ruminiclostridium cellobioparum subsp. termitidis CT1112]